MLAGNCGIGVGDVPHIGFIGRSIAEFHVFVDRVELFKTKVSSTIPTIKFVDIDPLDPVLFKNADL